MDIQGLNALAQPDLYLQSNILAAKLGRYYADVVDCSIFF